jgi:hypothetical protein
VATAETIREAQRSQPFRPFRLRLIDGTEYEVAHPDWISVPPARRAREVLVYLVGKDHDAEDERRWLDVGLISEVTIPPLPATPRRPVAEGDRAD